MKRFYIICQYFQEDKGSFMSFAEELAKKASKNYEVIIIARKKEKTDKKEEKTNYAKIYRFFSFNFPVFSTIFNELIFAFFVFFFLRKQKVSSSDIIFCNGLTALGLFNRKYVLRAPDHPSLVVLKSLEIDNSVSILTRIFRKIHFFLMQFLDIIVIKNASSIVFSSYANRKENLSFYKADKPYFIPANFTISSNFKEKKRSNVLFIARANEKIRKGVKYLEKALPVFFKKYPGINLIHIGEPFNWDVPEEYKNRIISKGLIKREDLYKYYIESSFLINTSLSEGFPSLILEAMSFKCPILTSDIIGVEDYIRHMESGYIYKRGDYKGLIKGLFFMAENKIKIKQMSLMAYKKAKKIEKEIYLKKLMQFIEETYNSKPNSVNLLR